MTKNRNLPVPERLWVGLLFAVAMIAAPAAPRARADDPQGVAVQVKTLEGLPLAGRLTSLEGGEVLVSSPTRAHRVDLGSIVSLRFVSPTAPVLPGEAHLRLTLVGGESILGRLAGATEDGILLDAPGLGRLPILFDVIRTLVPVPADAGPCHEPERRRAPTEEDVAYVTSGDAYQGIVLALEESGFAIETSRGRVRRVAAADLIVLHLANDEQASPEGLHVEVELVDGSRLLTAAGITLAEDELHFALRSLPEKTVAVPLDQVRVLRPHGGAFVYASSLPFESEFVPYYRDEPGEAAFLERWYAARADRRPTGCPLRIDGTTYRHGFAVHSLSRIQLPLAGAYARFESLFGVDDEALEVKAGGVVDARVLADGEVVWNANGVRAGSAPRRVGPLDVSGVKTLVLEVDYGAELHIRDRATWADPFLIRK